MVKDMKKREEDIKKLCSQVIKDTFLDEDINNGIFTCPYCGASGYKDDIDEIIHEKDCGWIISKRIIENYYKEESKRLSPPNIDNNDTDFWLLAVEFLNTQMIGNFESNFYSFMDVNGGFTRNEMMLFKSMLQEAMGLKITCAILKGDKNDK